MGSTKNQRYEGYSEEDYLLLNMKAHRMTGDIEKDSELYLRQQTERGKRILSELEGMTVKYSKIIGKPLKTGKLTPLYDSQTGRLIRYIET